MNRSKNVLALVVCEWDEMNFVHHLQQLSGRVKKKYSFSYSRWDSSPFDIDQYTEQCIDIVREKKIDLVVSGTDVSALVHAAIAETFPHIRGPSVESVFLTCHKYYSNTVLGSDLYQNRSVVLQLNQDMEEIMTIASGFFNSTGGTCFIKPVLGYSELGSRRITNLEDLHEAVSALKRDRHLHYITEKFIKKWISSEAYPLAATPCALLEEFCEFQYSAATMCSVQGGNILRTAMADWLRVKDRGCVYTSKFISAVIPPSVKKEEEMKAWHMTDRIVTKMIQKGFDDQSLNVEFFVLPNGDFKFMEINGRIDHILGPLCGQVYKHGDLVKNLLKLGSGEKIKETIYRGRVGFLGMVNTRVSGKAEDILDFQEISSTPEVQPLVAPDENILVDPHTRSSYIAYMSLTGVTLKDVKDKYQAICKRILKKPECSSLE